MMTPFRQTFTTPYQPFADREGEPFEVLHEITEAGPHHDADALPMYHIRFTSDDMEIEAWPEEVLA